MVYEGYAIIPTRDEMKTFSLVRFNRPEHVKKDLEHGRFVLSKYPTEYKGPLYSLVPNKIVDHTYSNMVLDVDCCYHYENTPIPKILSARFDFNKDMIELSLRGYLDQLYLMNNYMKNIWHTDTEFFIEQLSLQRLDLYGEPKIIYKGNEYEQVISMLGFGGKYKTAFDHFLAEVLPEQDPWQFNSVKYSTFGRMYYFINIDYSHLWYVIPADEWKMLNSLESINIQLFNRKEKYADPYMECTLDNIHDILYTCMEYPDHFFFDGTINNDRLVSARITGKLVNSHKKLSYDITYASELGATNLYKAILNLAYMLKDD